MKNFYYLICLNLCLTSLLTVRAQNKIFNYKKIINKKQPTTLIPNVQSISAATGDVTISGGDSRAPGTPFTFIWGDNATSQGFFPTSHKYADVTKNYVLQVVGNYSDNSKDTVELLVGFVKPVISKTMLDPFAKVIVPSELITLSSHFSYTPPKTLTAFSDAMFTGAFDRGDLEYILSVIGSIESNFMNSDIYLFEDKFQQYLFRDANARGGYSIWYSDPIAMAAGDALVNGTIDFSSLAHEMGHNFTLNTPAKYIFGGKIDGNANAAYSESMAQIFQHAAGYELINNYKKFGFDAEIYFSLVTNFTNSFNTLKNFHNQYLAAGKKFTTWNDPSTPGDEALPSFATTAYKFCEYAEDDGAGYTIPVKRMMQFLQRFNAEWHKRFDQSNNTEAANSFRATMMVAAVSHAFQRDLRTDFIALNYPVNDVDWAFLNPQVLEPSKDTLLLEAGENSTVTFTVTSNVEWAAKSSEPWLKINPTSGSGNQAIVVTALGNSSPAIRTAVITLSINGVAAKTVNVTQAAAAPILTVSAKTLDLNYMEGSTATFDVSSNVSWTAASSQAWLTISPLTGSQNSKVTATATANPLFESRKATVTLRATGAADQVVEIVQASPPITSIALPSELSVFPNPVKDLLQINGLNKKDQVEIYNISSHRVKSVMVGGQNTQVSIAHLPAGLYFIRISSASGTALMKIIKM